MTRGRAEWSDSSCPLPKLCVIPLPRSHAVATVKRVERVQLGGHRASTEHVELGLGR
jgi:hypothetical protein